MISLIVNGERHKVDASPDTPLLWVLRDHLGLTGTKYGCGAAQCGACAVLVDGQPQRSCVLPVGEVGGRLVVTIEGLDGAAIAALREAWVELDVAQCGYCQSGQLIGAAALLTRKPQPSDDDIDAAMAGFLCRCGTYQRIRAGIHAAARRLAVAGGSR
jgi:aerobic-type carbon monoxide dehydrogenase small subunit (CoxS/CutS family)